MTNTTRKVVIIFFFFFFDKPNRIERDRRQLARDLLAEYNKRFVSVAVKSGVSENNLGKLVCRYSLVYNANSKRTVMLLKGIKASLNDSLFDYLDTDELILHIFVYSQTIDALLKMKNTNENVVFSVYSNVCRNVRDTLIKNGATLPELLSSCHTKLSPSKTKNNDNKKRSKSEKNVNSNNYIKTGDINGNNNANINTGNKT